jgi:heterodisulfide reductase subunit D
MPDDEKTPQARKGVEETAGQSAVKAAEAPAADQSGQGRPRVIPVSSLDSKRIMQLQACTRCGECLNWCPVYDQDGREDILPRKKAADFLKILQSQHGLLAKIAGREDSGALAKLVGKVLGYKEVTGEQIREFAANLYECSTCGQCQIVCPANIDTVNLWEEIRRILVMADYGPLEQQKALVKSVKSYDNPWQQPRTARAKWTRRAKKDGLINDAPKDIQKKGGKILLYLGCTASYDTNVRQVALSTVNILDSLGVDYGILGNDEACCGSVMLRMGDPEFERVAKHNIDLFNSLGIDALVTSCSGCFKTISEDYPKVGKLNFEVMHTVQFLTRLLEQGKLNFKQPVEKVVTYHDPCHLGRASGVYDEPRIIMDAIPGLELVEMPRNREYSRCCGAGGGLKAGYPDIQNKMAQERVREAQGTGAQELVSCCPFCFQGLQIGINSEGSDLVARDLSFFVEEALGVRPKAYEKDKATAKPVPGTASTPPASPGQAPAPPAPAPPAPAPPTPAAPKAPAPPAPAPPAPSPPTPAPPAPAPPTPAAPKAPAPPAPAPPVPAPPAPAPPAPAPPAPAPPVPAPPAPPVPTPPAPPVPVKKESEAKEE